jgi:YggT family protein
MTGDPISLIIRTLGEVFAFIFILRFILQISGADYYNPISQAIVRFTQIPLAPLHKLIPRYKRFDASPLIAAFLIKLAAVLLLVLFSQGAMPNIVAALLFALFSLLDSLLTIYFWAVIGSVILSWVAPNSYHPGPQLILQITEPLFTLARRVVPSIGGLDLSPILIFLVIQILQSQISRLVM